LLVKPDFGVSTQWAYKYWQNSRELPGISYVQQDFRGQKLHNELERPVFEKFVFLARIKTWLLEQKEVAAALMSGSGSTVFAVVPSNVDVGLVAKRARKELDREIWTCVCETL
jgi:4-diphosphocytidyl-2-C-methyl-D-erythritol kinase